MIEQWIRQFETRRPQPELPRALTVHANGTTIPGWRLDGAERGGAGYLTLKLCLGGEGWFARAARVRRVAPGQALLFRSDDPAICHGFDGRGASHWRWLRFSWHGAGDQVAALVARGGHVLDVPPRDPLVRRLQGWRCADRAETLLDAAASAGLVWSVLAAVAGWIAGAAPSADAGERLCAAARARVADHLTDGTGVAAIAAELGVSAPHLSRVFRAASGETLQACLARQRLEHAATLLLDTDLPIKAVAGRIGYAQSAHFGRAFRARFGVTPGAYRRLGGVVG